MITSAMASPLCSWRSMSLRASYWPVHEAPSPSGVHPVSERHRGQSVQEKDDPCHRRQLCHPQASRRHGVARKTSTVCLPLHPDIRFLAQRYRGLLCQAHKEESQARRIPITAGTQRCHPPLPRPHQRKPKTLYLDQGPKQNYRRCQTRAPSVRFDPLVKFARLSVGDRSNDEPTKIVESLFYVVLSGTHAPIATRLKVIEGLLRSGDEAQERLG